LKEISDERVEISPSENGASRSQLWKVLKVATRFWAIGNRDSAMYSIPCPFDLEEYGCAMWDVQ